MKDPAGRELNPNCVVLTPRRLYILSTTDKGLGPNYVVGYKLNTKMQPVGELTILRPSDIFVVGPEQALSIANNKVEQQELYSEMWTLYCGEKFDEEMARRQKALGR